MKNTGKEMEEEKFTLNQHTMGVNGPSFVPSETFEHSANIKSDMRKYDPATNRKHSLDDASESGDRPFSKD